MQRERKEQWTERMKETTKKGEMNKWRMGGKKRKEERLMEVGVGVNDGKCVCCTPPSLSLSHSVFLCLLLSHSDMSIRRCFIGVSNDGRCCQGNYIAH